MIFKNVTNLDESEFIHDLSFSTNEPDAPKIPFKIVEDKESIHEFHKEFVSLVIHQDKEIGFVAITKLNEGFNIGLVLIPEARGKSLGKKIFQQKAYQLSLNYPKIKIFAATREDNLPAIKAIESAGFSFVSKEKKPAIPGACGEITYCKFKYDPT